MDLVGSASLSADPAVVFDHVADLGTYPDWLGIVFGAAPGPPHPDDPGPAWMVDLGAKIGPLPLTKRLRMVRTEHLPPKQARFERLEHDGQSHSAWVLLVEVEGSQSGSSLTIRLHYSGASRLPGVDAILRDEIRKAGGRLQGRLDARASG
ncbi:MAG: SRPBCC family protein [Acidimicrobiales bacterium]